MLRLAWSQACWGSSAELFLASFILSISGVPHFVLVYSFLLPGLSSPISMTSQKNSFFLGVSGCPTKDPRLPSHCSSLNHCNKGRKQNLLEDPATEASDTPPQPLRLRGKAVTQGEEGCVSTEDRERDAARMGSRMHATPSPTLCYPNFVPS